MSVVPYNVCFEGDNHQIKKGRNISSMKNFIFV